jgi:GTPase SAR1 family protein
MKARNEKEARILGEALLTRLTSIYPGLDGEVEVKPITKSDIYKKNYFWEIKLPKAPYLEEITLIRDFTNLFHRNKQEIKLYIQWKKATPKKIVKIREKIERMKFKDDKEKERYLETWREMLFKVRIFVSYQIFEKNPKELELELQLIEGRLKSLTMSSKNLKKPARLRSVTSGTLGNIIRANLFSGRYVTPKCIDFDIHENIPLFKPFILEHENVEFPPITEDDPDYIFIGKYLERGRRTEKNMPVHKNVFAQSALIVGQQGTGKTYLLAQIIQEFYDKCPDIGILILNLGKGNQEGFYKMDRVIKFGSPDFRVPYFYRGQYLERSLQETAAYLVAATGLKNVVEKNMINTMQAFINKYGKLSDSIYSLFKNLIDYFVKHPYHDRFQTNILRALKNRVLSLLTNPNLQKTLRLSNDSKIPTWFKEWRDGKKIYLDISMCSIYEKRLLTSAIFQMVRALTPDIELGKLQNIIVIDEAHQILEKPVSRNFDDDDFISRDQLEKIFNELLREFRSKGLSFILADQTPSRLFDCVTTLPSLKIIFRVGYPCNKIMIGNPNEQELLMLQRNRQALVLNGISGHKYLIESLDFVLPNKIKGENKDVINCPYCHTPVDNDAEYCMFCGKPLVLELPETAN